MTTNTNTFTVRDAFVDGLREFADFLDSHPDVEAPRGEKFLLALHTNDAVLSFAARFDRAGDVRIDNDGNTSFDLVFGPVVYHAYGYADFEDFRNRLDENQARIWAAKNNMALVPTEMVGGA